MKTSNKILLVAGTIPLVFVFILAIVIRITALNSESIHAFQTESYALETRTVLLDGFKKISTQGPFEINLVQGDEYLVEISAPGNIIDDIIAEKRGDALFLDSSDKSKRLGGLKQIQASITMPSISQIDMKGATTVSLSRFSIDSLSIRAEGMTDITGSKSTIHDLAFSGKGASNMELSSIPVTNADIECEGMFTIDLLMDGGVLSGDLRGPGKLSYEGDVSSNEIRAEGPFSKVVHRKM